MAGTSAPLEAG